MDPGNIAAPWKRTHQAMQWIAAGVGVFLAFAVFVNLLDQSPFVATFVASVFVGICVLGATPIVIGAILCSVAPDQSIAHWARVSLGSFFGAAGLESISILINVFHDRLPHHEAVIEVPPLLTVLVVGFTLMTVVAWILMHVCIGRRAGTPAMDRGVRYYVAAVIFAILIAASESPDAWLRSIGINARIANVALALVILGGQLLLTRTAMTALRPLVEEEAARPPSPVETPFEIAEKSDPNTWGPTRAGLLLMATGAGLLLISILASRAAQFSRLAPEGPPAFLDGPDIQVFWSARICVIEIAIVLFGLGGAFCCWTPDRAVAIRARCGMIGLAAALTAGVVVRIVLDGRRPRPFDVGFALNQPVPDAVELICLSIVVTTAFAAFASLVLMHAAIGRHFGKSHVGVVGAIYLALSMATISIDGVVHYVGADPLNVSQMRAMLTTDVVTAIVSRGGAIVLTWMTLAAMRRPLSARRE